MQKSVLEHRASVTTNNFVPQWHLTEEEYVILQVAIKKLVKAIRRGLGRKKAKDSHHLICPICMGDRYSGFLGRYHCLKRKCKSRGMVEYKYFMNHMEEFIGDILLGVELYGRTRKSGKELI